MDDVINDVINAQDSKSMRYIEQAKPDPESKTGWGAVWLRYFDS